MARGMVQVFSFAVLSGCYFPATGLVIFSWFLFHSTKE